MAHGGDTARTPAAAAANRGSFGASAIEDSRATRGSRLRDHWHRWRPVYVAFLASRALVLVVGFGAEVWARTSGAEPSTWRPFLHAETYPHYADVATAGYTLENAFDYPLLPGIMAAGHAIGLPMALTAFVVSNACFLLGLLGIATLGERYVGRAAAVRGATYLALAPFAYWFSIASTESLMLALLAGSVLLSLRGTPRSWLGAGVLAALAALARPPGAFVGIVLLCIAVDQLRRRRLTARGIASAVAAGVAIPLVVAGFFAYLAHRTGDALAAIHAQDQFNRALTLDGPLRAIRSGLDLAVHGYFGQLNELVATIGAAAFIAWFAGSAAGRRWEVGGWVAFGVASLMLPLATGVLWQMPRFALLVPPVFWGLGEIGSSRTVNMALLVLFPLALALNVALAVIGVEG